MFTSTDGRWAVWEDFFHSTLDESGTTLYLWQTNYVSAAVAPKLLQSCPTLCDPIDGSPPGSHPWDSPGKNTGVGCHFLLQCMKVKSESEVAQLSPTLSDPMDCSPPGSSVHGIFQAKEYCSGVPLPSPNYVSGTYKWRQGGAIKILGFGSRLSHGDAVCQNSHFFLSTTVSFSVYPQIITAFPTVPSSLWSPWSMYPSPEKFKWSIWGCCLLGLYLPDWAAGCVKFHKVAVFSDTLPLSGCPTDGLLEGMVRPLAGPLCFIGVLWIMFLTMRLSIRLWKSTALGILKFWFWSWFKN